MIIGPPGGLTLRWGLSNSYILNKLRLWRARADYRSMAARSFSIGQDKEGVYILEGELSIHDLDELRSFLDEALQGEEELSLSLAKVRFIDTAALQLLVAFKRRSASAAKLRISAVSPEIEGILSLSGLRTALL